MNLHKEKAGTLEFRTYFVDTEQNKHIPSVIAGGGGYVSSQGESSVHSGRSFWLAGISCHTLALGFKPAPFVVTCKIIGIYYGLQKKQKQV